MSATRSFPWSGLALAALLGLASAASAADVAGTRAAIDRGLDAQYPHIEALYKDIHSHPELGFQETRTAAKLAAEMRALGYEVTEGIGKTGIVALYKNGPGPTVMVRTELDALPMPEKTGLPYASTAKQMLARCRDAGGCIPAAMTFTWPPGWRSPRPCSTSRTSGAAR